MSKTSVRGTVRLKAYEVIARAVEDGVATGYRRAHKHDAAPSEETIKTRIEDAVLAELCDVLEFDGGE